MTRRLLMIVPTRSRPHNVAPLVEAWRETNAFTDGAELVLVVDVDDPERDAYLDAVNGQLGNQRRDVTWLIADEWEPLVPKLNRAATYLEITHKPFAIGFMGDDHRPRTPGWAKAYLDEGKHFAKGSMAPKIQAAILYLENGGKQALITNPENIGRALKGETGTWISS